MYDFPRRKGGAYNCLNASGKFGMLWPDGKLSGNRDNFAGLLRSGVCGMEAVHSTELWPCIMIHIERSGDYRVAVWFLDNLIAHHAPLDVIGLSYYPVWGSIAKLRDNLYGLALRYRAPIIVVETAYNWTSDRFVGKKNDFSESPQGQKDFLQDAKAAGCTTPDRLEQGVFCWEPSAEGVLDRRSFFDNDGNALPVITAFDQVTSLRPGGVR